MRRGAVLVALALPAGLAGCGADTLDPAGLEREIREGLARQTGERPRVDCPADRRAARDVTFRCRLRLEDGSPSAVVVTVLDEDGRFRFVLDPPSPG